MKTIILSTTIAALMLVISASRSMAHYDHDDRGWVDEHHHHHAYIHHNGHRGYWDHDNSGARVFISI